LLAARINFNKKLLSVDLYVDCTEYKHYHKNNTSSQQHFGLVGLKINIDKNKKQRYQNKDSQKLRNKIPESVTTSLHNNFKICPYPGAGNEVDWGNVSRRNYN
jgi:hypothetical protein